MYDANGFIQHIKFRRENMKKLLAVILILAMLFSFAACARKVEEPATNDGNNGGTETPAEEGWNADTQTYPFEDGAVLKVWVDNEDYGTALVEAWAKKYPDVELTYEVVGTVDQRAKLELDGPAGTGPDVFQLPHDHVSTAVNAGIAMELQPELAEYLKGRLIDTAMATANVGGKQYGAAVITESIALFYNKDLVGDFMPKTFEELVDWAGKYKEETGNYGLGWQVEDAYHNYFFLTAFGFKVFGENMNDAENPGWDSEAVAKGLEFYKSVKNVFDMPGPDANWDNTVAKFQNGELPFTITGPWAIGDAVKNGVNFGVMPLPTIAGNQPYTFSGAQILLISNYTKYPNAANNLLSFMASDEGLGIIYKTTGKLPAVKDATVVPGLADDENLKGIAAQAAFSYPMPVIPEIQYMWEPQAGLFKFVWNDELSIADSQKKAVEDYNTLRNAAQ